MGSKSWVDLRFRLQSRIAGYEIEYGDGFMDTFYNSPGNRFGGVIFRDNTRARGQ